MTQSSHKETLRETEIFGIRNIFSSTIFFSAAKNYISSKSKAKHLLTSL